MKRYVKILQRLLFALVLLPLLDMPVFGQCPTPEEVARGLDNFAAKGIQIVAVRPSAYAEICEVHVRMNNRDQIFYVGTKGDFFLMGQLYDAASGQNLTRTTIETITRFSPEEMAPLKDVAAVSVGNSGKTLYYATDPHCPYCKKGSEMLSQMAAAGEVQVKFIFFPLSKTSKEQSISVICDGKSMKEFESGYRSDNLCPDGVMKIDKTIRLLQGKGVGGTPTYIFPDGRFHTGLLKEGELRRRLGLPNPEKK